MQKAEQESESQHREMQVLKEQVNQHSSSAGSRSSYEVYCKHIGLRNVQNASSFMSCSLYVLM